MNGRNDAIFKSNQMFYIENSPKNLQIVWELVNLNIIFKYTTFKSKTTWQLILIFKKNLKILESLNKKHDGYSILKISKNFKKFQTSNKLNFFLPLSRLHKVETPLVTNKFLNLLFFFNIALYDNSMQTNHNFRFLYSKNLTGNLELISSGPFIQSWKEAYKLLYNLFYFEAVSFTLSTPSFKNEVISFNWNFSSLDLMSWKVCFPFFFCKMNSFSKKVDFFYKKLKKLELDYILLTDCNYHFKNVHFLKRNGFYTVGVITSNLNPWLVSFHIPMLSNSNLTQFFFFKFVLLIRKHATLAKFSLFKKIWGNFTYLKKSNLYL